MTEHLSTDIVQRFHQQALAAGDRAVIYDHVLECEACRGRIVDSRSEPIALQALSDHLLPGNDEESYHLDYEVIDGYIENKLDEVDRSTAELHFEVCAECLAEATDLRDSLATMRAVSVPQSLHKQSVRERLLRSTRFPAFSTPQRISAIVAAGVLIVLAAFLVWLLKSDRPSQQPAGKDLSAESKPTPIQSPTPISGVANPPITNPTPGPDRFAESPPSKRLNRSPEEVIALNDGLNRITLDKSGKLGGLETLPPETQRAVKDALLAQTIQKPGVLDDLASAEVSLRAPTGNGDLPRVVYPVSAVIVEDRPLFEWAPSATAAAYRIEVGDSNFHQVARSEKLPATSRTWTAPVALKRGMVYTWIVRVIKDGSESGSGSSPSQGKFKILEDEKVRELNRLKVASQSHLALGVFYAREGMIVEAERELQILVQENPHSEAAKKLLKEIQSWQTR